MHRQEIVEEILSRLPLEGCRATAVSLVCSEAELIGRLQQDVRRGIRSEDALTRGLNYLPLYAKLNTVKLDVSALSPEQRQNAFRRCCADLIAGSAARQRR